MSLSHVMHTLRTPVEIGEPLDPVSQTEFYVLVTLVVLTMGAAMLGLVRWA